MTTYMLGDVPAAPVLLSPARDGRTVNLEPFTDVVATLQQPDGASSSATAQLLDDDDEGRVVSVLLPALTVPGLGWLELILSSSTARERFTVPVVVQLLDGWHTLASARAEWEDAEALADARLFTLLEVSRIECAAWAPKLAPGQLPPVNYREAQLTHARNRNAAWRVDPVNGSDETTYNIGAFPMDWVVKQMLRPQQGRRTVL